MRPYLLQLTIDNSIVPQDNDQLLFYIGLNGRGTSSGGDFPVLFYLFRELAWAGSDKGSKGKLFKHMLQFKMKYFDNSAVGRLVTRAVSDIETIASIFSQGLFMIISDLLKMIVVLGLYVLSKLETYPSCPARTAFHSLCDQGFSEENETGF